MKSKGRDYFMECPFCGCQSFYVKDPHDEYETHEFDVSGGKVVFSEEPPDGAPSQVNDETESYCTRCAWHGKVKNLK
jgi:hypothetical protein